MSTPDVPFCSKACFLTVTEQKNGGESPRRLGRTYVLRPAHSCIAAF